MDEADLVIWACGYETNSIPMADSKGEAFQLSKQQEICCQVDVDKNCRIYLADGGHVLTRAFGSGIGYP